MGAETKTQYDEEFLKEMDRLNAKPKDAEKEPQPIEVLDEFEETRREELAKMFAEDEKKKESDAEPQPAEEKPEPAKSEPSPEPVRENVGDPLDLRSEPTAEPPALDDERIEKVEKFFDKHLNELGHGDYQETYRSRDFEGYIKDVISKEIEDGMSFYETSGIQVPKNLLPVSPTWQKLNSANPLLHAEVLREYQQQKTTPKKETHKEPRREAEPVRRVRTLNDLEPEEITKLSSAEFRRLLPKWAKL